MKEAIVILVGCIWLVTVGFMAGHHVGKRRIEKEIPKKIKIVKANDCLADYRCPMCGTRCITKMNGEWLAGAFYNHCYICGQALDWEDAWKNAQSCNL